MPKIRITQESAMTVFVVDDDEQTRELGKIRPVTGIQWENCGGEVIRNAERSAIGVEFELKPAI